MRTAFPHIRTEAPRRYRRFLTVREVRPRYVERVPWREMFLTGTSFLSLIGHRVGGLLLINIIPSLAAGMLKTPLFHPRSIGEIFTCQA